MPKPIFSSIPRREPVNAMPRNGRIRRAGKRANRELEMQAEDMRELERQLRQERRLARYEEPRADASNELREEPRSGE